MAAGQQGYQGSQGSQGQNKITSKFIKFHQTASNFIKLHQQLVLEALQVVNTACEATKCIEMSCRSSLSMHVLSLAMPFKRRYIIDFGVKPSTRIHMRVRINVGKTSPHHSKRTTLWPNNLLKAGSSPPKLRDPPSPPWCPPPRHHPCLPPQVPLHPRALRSPSGEHLDSHQAPWT